MADEHKTELPFIVELTWHPPHEWRAYAAFYYSEAAQEFIKRRTTERPDGPAWRVRMRDVVLFTAAAGKLERL